MVYPAASNLAQLQGGIPLNPLPELIEDDPTVPHAPRRTVNPLIMKSDDWKLALTNALRYFPTSLHETLAPEFAAELKKYGRVYMKRFRPKNLREMKARPINEYPAKSRQAAAIMLMIQNNLDPNVAQFPEELITYGGNGTVFQNWAQYWLVMKYLSEMTEKQTLVMYSGHPMGLFPSHPDAPRVVVTNGMVVWNYSSKDLYDKYSALGVTMYGQMTAGSYAYIGPQGIVHGTTLTVLNAGRKYLSTSDLAGKVFITSGLGGMSGAQAKAAVICGCVAVVAEISPSALKKRHEQGWLSEHVGDDLDKCIARVKTARKNKESVSIGYLGNVVDLWEKFAEEEEMLVELGSDQTSCHNVFGGGYYPVGVSFDDANKLLEENPSEFKSLVQKSLIRHVAAVNKLTARGMRFWDYGNSFLLEAGRAGADIFKGDPSDGKYLYPSYVEEFMGSIFSLGFGPFRWVCLSGEADDLDLTDKIAAEEIERMMGETDSAAIKGQHSDNLKWIKNAKNENLVVGSQARILYSDAEGRMQIALRFNEAVKDGRLKGPVVISRDHHDVSGTDSPYRETNNVVDGSRFTADMAIQNVIGDSFRGATWVSIHNGGGTGWGEAVNGGFGMVLDGTNDAARRAELMLTWDVCNGLARRAWAGNELADVAVDNAVKRVEGLAITRRHNADSALIDRVMGDNL